MELELAERVLALPHLNRKLNCEISELLGEQFNHAFTSSLDAARHLVPAGYVWAAGTALNDDTGKVVCWAHVRNPDPFKYDDYFDVSLEAATPEIALTAAALKARAHVAARAA